MKQQSKQDCNSQHVLSPSGILHVLYLLIYLVFMITVQGEITIDFILQTEESRPR